RRRHRGQHRHLPRGPRHRRGPEPAPVRAVGPPLRPARAAAGGGGGGDGVGRARRPTRRGRAGRAVRRFPRRHLGRREPARAPGGERGGGGRRGGLVRLNVTMSLGAGALARPLRIGHAAQLHGPWLAMIATLAGVLALALPRRRLDPAAGWVLLAAYPIVVVAVLAR